MLKLGQSRSRYGSMIREKSSAVRASAPLWAILLLTISHGARSESAAELDWVATPTGQCQGTYVDSGRQTSDLSSDQIHATAGSILHVRDHSTTLVDDIQINNGEQQIRGDFATIDAETEIYTVEGNIEIREPGLLITGETIQGNMITGTAAVDSASFLIHQSRIRGKAAKISTTEDNRLLIDSGEFTTCEPDSNVWSIEGRSIELITDEGYGEARHVILNIKDIPVAYFPYFRFPIDDSRQSGGLCARWV